MLALSGEFPLPVQMEDSLERKLEVTDVLHYRGVPLLLLPLTDSLVNSPCDLLSHSLALLGLDILLAPISWLALLSLTHQPGLNVLVAFPSDVTGPFVLGSL